MHAGESILATPRNDGEPVGAAMRGQNDHQGVLISVHCRASSPNVRGYRPCGNTPTAFAIEANDRLDCSSEPRAQDLRRLPGFTLKNALWPKQPEREDARLVQP
jgi:hypothetical protein